jgi:hypothetical protein
MKQKIYQTSKKRVKFVTEDKRQAEIAYVGKFKTVVRYADTTIFDQYLFQEKINPEQFQIAEWIYALAMASGINISTSSFLNNPSGVRGSGVNDISEKSVNARIVLDKCLCHIKQKRGPAAQSLLEALVIYQKSIREWARSTSSSRQGKLDLFKQTLDDLIHFRNNHI